MNNKIYKRGDYCDIKKKYFWSYINKGCEYWIPLEKLNEFRKSQSSIEYKGKKRRLSLSYRETANGRRREKYSRDTNYKNRRLHESKVSRKKNKKKLSVDRLACQANYTRARKEQKFRTPLILRSFCQLFYDTAKFLESVTGEKHHVDHIIPLSRGGRHDPWNLQVLTAEENLKKSNKI